MSGEGKGPYLSGLSRISRWKDFSYIGYSPLQDSPVLLLLARDSCGCTVTRCVAQKRSPGLACRGQFRARSRPK